MVWQRNYPRHLPCAQIAEYVESVAKVCTKTGRSGYGQSRNVADGWLVIAAGTKTGQECTNRTIVNF